MVTGEEVSAVSVGLLTNDKYPHTDLSELGGKLLLTRAGHTEERDELILFLRDDLLRWNTLEEACSKLEELIEEHQRNPAQNRLRQIIPKLTVMHTHLCLVKAFKMYDHMFHLSKRRHVKPSFADLRHILNIAQMAACMPGLKMVTMDGDGTLYRHNQCVENTEMVQSVLSMLRLGLVFGLVTAAGYPGCADRYEARLGLILQGIYEEMQKGSLPEDVLSRFFVIGGECNYLLRAEVIAGIENGPGRLGLRFVAGDEWKTEEMLAWSAEAIKDVLDRGTEALKEVTERLNMPVQIVRKERAVGIIPTQTLVTVEDLDEVVLTVHHELHDVHVPFCAFNSRSDVWLDIGSKGKGIKCMLEHYNIGAAEALHFGDELYLTGNDRGSRESCCTVWVENELETPFYLRLLLHMKLEKEALEDAS